jgi:glucose uptake protein GlcU
VVVALTTATADKTARRPQHYDQVKENLMTILAALLWQEQKTNLTLNWIIIGVLLVIAAILGVIVIQRRRREQQDDDYDR